MKKLSWVNFHGNSKKETFDKKWFEEGQGLTSTETGRERFQKKWFEEHLGLTFMEMETGKERFDKKWFEEVKG